MITLPPTPFPPRPLFLATLFLSLSVPLQLCLSHTAPPPCSSPSLTLWMTLSLHLASQFILHNSFWLGLLSPCLNSLPPPIPIKDLRAPLSANQVVIRAAKIRGLINKGLSLLASGSLCLNRWHQSASWAHQIDARTPGVPWNGKQRQSLALANNTGMGSLLPIFRGSLTGLVLHSPSSVFSPSLITTGLFSSPVGRDA